MKFLIAGYGSKTGEQDNSFKTLRLTKEGTIRTDYESISYGKRKREDAVLVGCKTRKVNKNSVDSSVRVFIYSLNKDEAYTLAAEVINLAESVDRSDGDDWTAKPSTHRKKFLERLVGNSDYFIDQSMVSDTDIKHILEILLHDTKNKKWDAEHKGDQSMLQRLAARKRLIGDLMRTYDETHDFTPGPKAV